MNARLFSVFKYGPFGFLGGAKEKHGPLLRQGKERGA